MIKIEMKYGDTLHIEKTNSDDLQGVFRKYRNMKIVQEQLGSCDYVAVWRVRR